MFCNDLKVLAWLSPLKNFVVDLCVLLVTGEEEKTPLELG